MASIWPALVGCLVLFVLVTDIRTAAAAAEEVSSDCVLNATTLNRFRYLTFYGWHIDDGNWTNVGQSPSLEELAAFFHLTGRPSLLELMGVFFEPMANVDPKLQGLTLRSDWESRWSTLRRATGVHSLSHLVSIKAITGFFLCDELVWNITWHQLNETSFAVKTAFPDCYVWYNEGGAPLWGSHNINHYHIHYPYVPLAIDYVSTDDYDPMQIRKNPRWMYESFLYPKMKAAHQRAWIVPPVYGWVNKTCDATCWDDIELYQAQQYWQWVDEDERLVGASGFHSSTYGPHDLGLVSLPRTLLCYRQISEQLIAHEQQQTLRGIAPP